jgi:hypothetical protein
MGAEMNELFHHSVYFVQSFGVYRYFYVIALFGSGYLP